MGKRIIKEKKIRAKKSLGQNFLINKSKLRKITDVLELKKDDTIIEIGPGHGELTMEIIGEFDNLGIRNFRIICIEKDNELAEALKEKFSKDKNIEVIEGDALKVLPTLNTKYKLVGNIPYYITGYLLRIISELEKKPEITVLTIQKEVAQRICVLRQAQGKPKMNLLAASVQFWAEPKIIGYIPKKDFRPMPKVDSAIIRLKATNNKQQIKSENYYKLVKILFKQPRKTILNNFCDAKKADFDKCRKNLLKVGINPLDRPQNLAIKQLKELSGYDTI